MKVLALVPARAGSKGIPYKNVATVANKPLIQWSIEVAQQSTIITDVVVSTDCRDIAQLSLSLGAEVPFLRPAHLATDTSSSLDVVLDALTKLEHLNRSYEYIYLIEPTSPLRTSEDINRSFELITNSTSESLISIAECKSAHPDFLYYLHDYSIEPYSGNQVEHARRQDLSPLFYPDGSLYCSSVTSIRQTRTFYRANTIGYLVKPYQSIEIDDPHDMVMAEALLLDRLRHPTRY